MKHHFQACSRHNCSAAGGAICNVLQTPLEASFAATVRYRRWGCAVLALLVRRWFTGACVGVPLVHWCAAGPLVHWWAAGALVGHWYAVGFPKINK